MWRWRWIDTAGVRGMDGFQPPDSENHELSPTISRLPCSRLSVHHASRDIKPPQRPSGAVRREKGETYDMANTDRD
jgi:hypothetical protein